MNIVRSLPLKLLFLVKVLNWYPLQKYKKNLVRLQFLAAVLMKSLSSDI